MTANGRKPRARPQRRIIERPRLIKLLDDSDARTILLIAPAGYGKTTLARQWAKTLNGAVWVTLTAAHRDVAWLAEDLAAAFDAAGAHTGGEIRAHIQAQANPQLASSELGRVLAHLSRDHANWVVFDDYHEIAAATEAEALIASFESHASPRVVVTSRTRPSWISARRLLYGDAAEVSRTQLAMTTDEATEILGDAGRGSNLLEQAEGWPAVIALASTLEPRAIPHAPIPSTLHRYLAEELFARAPIHVQEAWLTLSLLPGQTGQALSIRFGNPADEIRHLSTELGFNGSETGFELHPLLREFLLEKLAGDPTGEVRVRAAVSDHIESGAWDWALDLVTRFRLEDLVESTLEQAFQPLARSGRLETLAQFARRNATDKEVLSPAIQLTLAEVALRDGELDLARVLAGRARSGLAFGHHLASRAAAIAGRAAFLLADFEAAGAAFHDAQETAQDSVDAMEATHGLASASVFGEQSEADAAIKGLAAFATQSATQFLRYASIVLDFKRIGGSPEGLTLPLNLAEGRDAHRRSEDPRARTAFAYAAAGALNFRAEYEKAEGWLSLLFEDIERFDLEFVLPYANWALGQSALGLRRFGAAERALQAIEDAATRASDRRHEMNARALRARLFLQTGEAATALRLLRPDPDFPVISSWRAEYFATRALANACEGHTDAALRDAASADALTVALDVTILSEAARCVARGSRAAECLKLIERADTTWVWDPVVSAVRSSPSLADTIAASPETRDLIASVYARTGDASLAKRAGIRTRSTKHPDQVLTPRELEVLGLISRGYKNRDISRALFIADSTTKVHVRHILEKLGVRTRAEAVARYHALRGGDGD